VRFELTVLREIGQLPSLDACIVCGKEAVGENEFGYWVAQGGLICQQCQKQEYSQTQIHAGTVAVLNRLSGPSSAGWPRVVLSPQQLKEIRHLLTASISQALGRRPKMLSYLKPS
jgi:DNA repair protein RecO (recombination protein O)